MCQSNVYTIDNDQETLLLEEVALVEVDGDRVIMKTLFGEPLTLSAQIKKIDLIKNRIILERYEPVS